METLHRQIRRARIRMFLQSFVGHLGWSCFITLGLAVVAIGALKIWPPADPQFWYLAIACNALAAGILGALVWTFIKRNDDLTVASEIDRRFGLKERVSSTLWLSPHERESEIGQALTSDALARLARIDVPSEFPVRVDRSAWLPLLPAACALGLALFVGVRAPATTTAERKAENEQVKNSVQSLAKKLEEKRKEAAEAGLKEEDGLLTQLVQGTKDLAEKSQADRKQTLVALNDLVKDAEKRRQQLNGSMDLKQQLNQLKNLQPGPAQKLANAMKNGDLKMAMQELAKLQEKMASNKLDPQEREQLAKQLEQMQQSLEKMASAQREAEKDLRERIAMERKAGNTSEVDKLQKQLDKLASQAQQAEQAEKMAKQMAAAAQAMKQGDNQQAAQAMSELSDQLANMAMEVEEVAMLDDALEQLGDCKNALNCSECNGEGCKECQADGGMKFGNKFSKSDFAKGQGRGAGKRDKEESDAGFIDSNVPQNVGKGAMVVKGAVDGKNRKGLVQEAIKEEFTGAAQEEADTLTDQRLPHDYRDHAKDYFEALREAGK